MACKQGFQLSLLFLFSDYYYLSLDPVSTPFCFLSIHSFIHPFYSLHFVFFTPLSTLFSSNPCLKKKRIPGGHIFKTTTQPNSLCYITKLTKVTYTLPFIFRLLGLVGH